MDQLWFPPSYKIQEKITKPFIPFTHTVQTEREEITQKKKEDKQLATSVQMPMGVKHIKIFDAQQCKNTNKFTGQE